jgi:hypothetical protein
MNKFVQAFGALVALFSFSACSLDTPYHAAYGSVELSAQVNSSQYDGYVNPTDWSNCIQPNKTPKDPPLPKNVPNATWYSGGTPPLKYQKDIKVTMYFDNPNVINKTLYEGKRAICGYTLYAYTYPDTKTMHLPNPCVYPQTDAYARLACHEMGHANGWPGYHGDK